MNTTDLQCFAFEDHLVRVVMRDGKPWFVTADICRILEIKDVSQAVEKLDDDEKGPGSIRTLGGEQVSWLVSESGLYTIILRSRSATTPGTPAHSFRKWVTDEVLPQIRKTGAYAVEGKEPDVLMPGDPRFDGAVRLVAEARRSRGPAAALQLWRALGLPWVPEMQPFSKASQEDDKYLHPVEEWWMERLREGSQLRGGGQWLTEVSKRALADDFSQWSNHKPSSMRADSVTLALKLRHLVPRLGETRKWVQGTSAKKQQERMWIFPTLDVCRKFHEAHIDEGLGADDGVLSQLQ